LRKTKKGLTSNEQSKVKKPFRRRKRKTKSFICTSLKELQERHKLNKERKKKRA
jgi:hypothetical protein